MDNYILLTEVKPRRWRYPRPRRDNLYIALGCFAIAMIAAIAAWGQTVRIVPQTGTNGYYLLSEPPEVHYRCVKLKDDRYRFEPIDDLDAPAVVLTCVNCSCGDEK